MVFDTLIQQHFGELSKDELAIIQSYFHEEKLSKNEYFYRIWTDLQ